MSSKYLALLIKIYIQQILGGNVVTTNLVSPFLQTFGQWILMSIYYLINVLVVILLILIYYLITILQILLIPAYALFVIITIPLRVLGLTIKLIMAALLLLLLFPRIIWGILMRITRPREANVRSTDRGTRTIQYY